jgi:prophage regulatory protein
MTTNATQRNRQALRLPKVLEKTGLSRTHLYRLIQLGKFPRAHKLSERVSVFDERDIDAWLAQKFEG